MRRLLTAFAHHLHLLCDLLPAAPVAAPHLPAAPAHCLHHHHAPVRLPLFARAPAWRTATRTARAPLSHYTRTAALPTTAAPLAPAPAHHRTLLQCYDRGGGDTAHSFTRAHALPILRRWTHETSAASGTQRFISGAASLLYRIARHTFTTRLISNAARWHIAAYSATRMKSASRSDDAFIGRRP